MATEIQGVQDETPVATKGFGAREAADETRQSQHSFSNDTPTDVNVNAVVGREQTGTFVLMGKNFESAATRRNGLFDHCSALLMAKMGESIPAKP